MEGKNMNIKHIILLLIPITIGIQINAANKSNTIYIINKTGSSLWFSTQYNLENPTKIDPDHKQTINLSSPGSFAYITNQELPFESGSCTTLAITYFKSNPDIFFIYMQRFKAIQTNNTKETTIQIDGPGMLHPKNNSIQGNTIYIHNHPYSSVELTATNSPANPFQIAA